MTDFTTERSNFFKDSGSDVSFYDPVSEQIDIAEISGGTFSGHYIGLDKFQTVDGNYDLTSLGTVDVVGRGDFLGDLNTDYLVQSQDHTHLTVLDNNGSANFVIGLPAIDPNFEPDTFNGRTDLFGNASPDGNRDGILLHNTVDGRVYDVTLSSQTVGQQTTFTSTSHYIGNIDPALHIVATADFEGFNAPASIAADPGFVDYGLNYTYDSTHSDDILAVATKDITDAQNNVIGHQGDMVIFTVVDGAITGSSSFVPLNGWTPLFAGDFDYAYALSAPPQLGLTSGTDGAADIVFGKSAGTDANGNTIMHYGVEIGDGNGLAGDPVDSSPPSATDGTNHWIDLGQQASWKIVGVGSYGGDVGEDILWQNTNTSDALYNHFAYTDLVQADQQPNTPAGTAAAWHDLGLALTANSSYHLIG